MGSRIDIGPTARTAMVLAAVGFVFFQAFNYTYLKGTLDPTAPLAVVPLVPAASAFLAFWGLRRKIPEPSVLPDRAADLTIAGLFLVAGVATLFVAPRAFGPETLTWRADLLALPLLVAAFVAGVFGVRILYRTREAVALLALMSPALLRPLISSLESAVTFATTSAVRLAAGPLPGVSSAPGAGQEYLLIAGPNSSFTVSVAQACSGAGTVLVGALLGLTLVPLLTGSPRRKAGWFLSVLALAWLANLLRIGLLLWAGRALGPEAMLGWVHSAAGPLAICLGSAAALALLSVWGLRVDLSWLRGGAVRRTLGNLPRFGLGGAVAVAALAGLLAVPAAQATTSHDLLVGDSQTAVAASAAKRLADYPGAEALRSVTWASAFFGTGAEWQRALIPVSASEADTPVLAVDVIRTRKPGTLDQYGVESCLRFHDYAVLSSQRVALRGDRIAEELHYRDPVSGQDVLVLSWRQQLSDGVVERVLLTHRGQSQDEDRLANLHLFADDILAWQSGALDA